jgi:hypothetical protein
VTFILPLYYRKQQSHLQGIPNSKCPSIDAIKSLSFCKISQYKKQVVGDGEVIKLSS